MNYRILKLGFWFLRKLNNDEPSRPEVGWALSNYDHTDTIRYIMMFYYMGWDYSDLSIDYKWTRERIKQIIRKGVVQAREAYESRTAN